MLRVPKFEQNNTLCLLLLCKLQGAFRACEHAGHAVIRCRIVLFSAMVRNYVSLCSMPSLIIVNSNSSSFSFRDGVFFFYFNNDSFLLLLAKRMRPFHFSFRNHLSLLAGRETAGTGSAYSSAIWIILARQFPYKCWVRESNERAARTGRPGGPKTEHCEPKICEISGNRRAAIGQTRTEMLIRIDRSALNTPEKRK